MDVYFSSKKLMVACTVEKEMKKHWDPITRRKLDQRFAELEAATNLSDISHLPPPRLHEYAEDPRGKLSVDVHGAVRILFRPHAEEVPRRDDGGLDRAAVTAIEVISVDDPHGKKHKKQR